MKRTYALSVILLGITLFLNSCAKNQALPTNENYWFSKERGEVVYSDTYCSYFVVETYNGYTILHSYGTYKPFEGDVVYGNFSSRGTRNMYNYSTGYVFTGTITDYWLTYTEAQNALDYYCPLYGKGEKREFKKSTINRNN